MELFLFLTTLLQSFSFQLTTESKEMDLLTMWRKIERKAILGTFVAVRRTCP